jgi:hypothetical protein
VEHVQANGWTRPEYWHDVDGVPHVFGLDGLSQLVLTTPSST